MRLDAAADFAALCGSTRCCVAGNAAEDSRLADRRRPLRVKYGGVPGEYENVVRHRETGEFMVGQQTPELLEVWQGFSRRIEAIDKRRAQIAERLTA
jgi:hypothetical protein